MKAETKRDKETDRDEQTDPDIRHDPAHRRHNASYRLRGGMRSFPRSSSSAWRPEKVPQIKIVRRYKTGRPGSA